MSDYYDEDHDEDYEVADISDDDRGDSRKRPLADEYEDLYGLLLLADQKISNVGTAVIWFLGTGVLALCVAIHMKWLDQALNVDLSALRGAGVYFLATVIAFLLFIAYNNHTERAVYASFKPEIIESLRRNDLTLYQLLARIEDDKTLNNISEQLKDDRQIQPASDADRAVR